MTVTVDLVNAAVKAVFGNEPLIAQDSDGVVFGITAGNYFGRCCIEVTDYADADDPATCLVIFIFFHAADGETEHDFRNLTDDVLLALCNEIDLSLNWTGLSLLKGTDGSREFQLHRSIRISRDVLENAIKQDASCELHWALLYLYREYMLVAPIIDNLANGTHIDPEHVHYLFTESTGQQHA